MKGFASIPLVALLLAASGCGSDPAGTDGTASARTDAGSTKTDRSESAGAEELAGHMSAMCTAFSSAENAADAGQFNLLKRELERVSAAVEHARATGATEADDLGRLVTVWVTAAADGDMTTAQLHAAGVIRACDSWVI